MPAPLLGVMLEDIRDVAELKVTLRFFWHFAQRRGAPRTVDAAALENDSGLLSTLGSVDEVRRGLALAVERGTLLRTGDAAYAPGTPEGQRAAAHSTPRHNTPPRDLPLPAERPTIFALYESNIGMLTPILVDELRDAEEFYPAEWVEAAFREAVENNARSWRYVSTLLARWEREGRGPNGKPGRHPEKVTAAEYRRLFGKG